jgi:hypothetical protein
MRPIFILLCLSTSRIIDIGPYVFDGTVCFLAQDEASPHKAPLVQTWLTERFGEKIITKNEWPPRSPDLNPCDYLLWDFLKKRVYNQLPKKLEDLRSNLTREIENISAQM